MLFIAWGGFDRVGLNSRHQGRDLLSRLASILGETLHLVRDDRKPAARIAGGDGLHGCVQSKHRSAFRNLANDSDDGRDLLRPLAEPLDALFGFSDLIPRQRNALDGCSDDVHRFAGSGNRALGGLGGLLRLVGNLFQGACGLRQFAGCCGGLVARRLRDLQHVARALGDAHRRIRHIG